MCAWGERAGVGFAAFSCCQGSPEGVPGLGCSSPTLLWESVQSSAAASPVFAQSSPAALSAPAGASPIKAPKVSAEFLISSSCPGDSRALAAPDLDFPQVLPKLPVKQ